MEFRRARRLGAPNWPDSRLGAPCMSNHNGIFAAMRRRHTRGETRSFSPLANHPISFGREQTYRSLPEDLRHLLPQIRARCARKVRNGKVSAAQLLKSNKKGRFHPSGALLFHSRRGAHRAPVLWGGIYFAYPAQAAGRHLESVTYFCARSAPYRRG